MIPPCVVQPYLRRLGVLSSICGLAILSRMFEHLAPVKLGISVLRRFAGCGVDGAALLPKFQTSDAGHVAGVSCGGFIVASSDGSPPRART